jgi:hypothetical protein
MRACLFPLIIRAKDLLIANRKAGGLDKRPAAVAASLALQVGILTIPIMEPIFKVAPLPLEDWELMVAMALLPLAVVEAIKWFQRRASAGLQKARGDQ